MLWGLRPWYYCWKKSQTGGPKPPSSDLDTSPPNLCFPPIFFLWITLSPDNMLRNTVIQVFPSVSLCLTCSEHDEGKRLHDHQVILDSKVWGKAWTLFCRKPTSVFCNLARNVVQLQHTEKSPLQWHKEEVQTLISPAQTGKRSTGGYWLSYNTQGAAGNHHIGQGQIPHTMINERSKQLHLFGTFSISPCSEDPQLLCPISFC